MAHPFPAKFTAGRCELCRQPVVKGQSIYYVRGEGSTHETCWEEYRAEAAREEERHNAWNNALLAEEKASRGERLWARWAEFAAPAVDFGHGFTSHNSDQCARCGGKGTMPFKVADGVCFKCEGAGRVLLTDRQLEARKREVAEAQEGKRMAEALEPLALAVKTAREAGDEQAIARAREALNVQLAAFGLTPAA